MPTPVYKNTCQLQYTLNLLCFAIESNLTRWENIPHRAAKAKLIIYYGFCGKLHLDKMQFGQQTEGVQLNLQNIKYITAK